MPNATSDELIALTNEIRRQHPAPHSGARHSVSGKLIVELTERELALVQWALGTWSSKLWNEGR